MAKKITISIDSTKLAIFVAIILAVVAFSYWDQNQALKQKVSYQQQLLAQSTTTPVSTGAADSLAPASIVKKLTTISATTFSTVASGSNSTLPSKISAPALIKNQKPLILYAGAEYCPFCAAERWPLIIALSRFGSFSHLLLSHSSMTDVYANTQTFSFHTSTYSSPYITFEGVETLTNQSQNGGYAALDALSTPNDPISQAVIGAANVLTATICLQTNNQPEKVCSDPVIQTIESSLNSQTALGATK